MATFSDFLENKILDHLFGNTAYSPPATLHIALYTVAPNFETGAGGTEVAGGSYARAAVTNNTTNFPNASGGLKSNGTAINYVTPTAGWGTVVAFGLLDAASSGNFLGGNTLVASKVINSGDPVSFAPGELDITLN